jgi:hypothetical protein
LPKPDKAVDKTNRLSTLYRQKGGEMLTDENHSGQMERVFEELLTLEIVREHLEEAAPEKPEKDIISKEIEDAIKLVNSNKALGPNGITAGMLKALGKDGV